MGERENGRMGEWETGEAEEGRRAFWCGDGAVKG